ncbi:type II toxin-antitoxin system HicB family antitoxin [uncultured Rikenella sp.]|uniref:type II toxin-antitoxin system HicB family antitoxin n=1 Tax=uncultured Rikenella sp. TaxID=368003 RepID=UPI0025DB1E55|nr:type II toxin-antitoxin system HicB family antitoxin [uncultured Rikenella sp.]
MEKVIINVSWDKNYSAAPANEGVCVVVAGKTLDEVKERMEYSLGRHLAGMRADGDPIPAEFAGEYELEYHLNVRALLHYTEGLVPRTALARASGINVKQLTHYASGWRTPRPEMERRITNGIRAICQQLSSVSL